MAQPLHLKGYTTTTMRLLGGRGETPLAIEGAPLGTRCRRALPHVLTAHGHLQNGRVGLMPETGSERHGSKTPMDISEVLHAAIVGGYHIDGSDGVATSFSGANSEYFCVDPHR